MDRRLPPERGAAMTESDHRNDNDNKTDQPGYADAAGTMEGEGMYHSDETQGETKAGSKAIEELLAVARDLRANLNLLVGAGRNVANEQAGRLRQVAGEQAGRLRENAGRVYQRGKERAGVLADNTGDYVKDEPIKALAIAAGAGLVLGYLLKRTR